MHSKKHVVSLLIEEEGKKHYVSIKDFNTFTYDHTFHRGRKHFLSLLFTSFKCDIKDYFKRNGKQRIQMSKNGQQVKLKNFERKRKSTRIIYADFESILVPVDNGKQSPEQSNTKKYQKHVAYSYGYKLAVCVYDKFSELFKLYLGKDAVYNFVKSMIEESKCCSDVMRIIFTKKL